MMVTIDAKVSVANYSWAHLTQKKSSVFQKHSNGVPRFARPTKWLSLPMAFRRLPSGIRPRRRSRSATFQTLPNANACRLIAVKEARGQCEPGCRNFKIENLPICRLPQLCIYADPGTRLKRLQAQIMWFNCASGSVNELLSQSSYCCGDANL